MEFFRLRRRFFLTIAIGLMWFVVIFYALASSPFTGRGLVIAALSLIVMTLNYLAIRLTNLQSPQEYKEFRQLQLLSEAVDELNYERDLRRWLAERKRARADASARAHNKRKRLEDMPYTDGELSISELLEDYDTKQKR